MPHIPVLLLLLCLLLVVGGLVVYFFRPTPGFAIVCVGLILYFLILLVRSA